VDGQGRIVIATYPERAKTRNARRDPEHVSVMFLSDDFGGPWVQVDGTAEVLDIPEAVEPLVDYFRAISGVVSAHMWPEGHPMISHRDGWGQ
jgi:hypothetical protein